MGETKSGGCFSPLGALIVVAAPVRTREEGRKTARRVEAGETLRPLLAAVTLAMAVGSVAVPLSGAIAAAAPMRLAGLPRRGPLVAARLLPARRPASAPRSLVRLAHRLESRVDPVRQLRDRNVLARQLLDVAQVGASPLQKEARYRRPGARRPPDAV